MKLVVQRVVDAEVLVGGRSVGKIKKGLFVLLGIKKGDTEKDVDFLAEKLSKLRIMSDLPRRQAGENSKMNFSILDTDSEVLVVSQFTLYANTKDGNRPSFIEVEEPQKAKKLYQYFVEKLKEKGIKVKTGEFGAYMDIKTELDGPVTIILES